MTVVSEHRDRVVREEGDRFVKEFRDPRAMEAEVERYRRLARAGVGVPRIVEARGTRLVTRRLPGRPLDEIVRDEWASLRRSERNRIIERVAEVCRRIRDAGYDWPDLVTYHVFVARDRVSVLDPARLRRGRLDLSPLHWSAEEPTVSRSDRLRFWRAYAGDAPPPRLRRIGHRGRFRPYRWARQRAPIRACPPWGRFVKTRADLPYSSADEVAGHPRLVVRRRMPGRTNARLSDLHVKITRDPREAEVEWENHRMMMAAGFRVPQPAVGGVLEDGRGLFATFDLEGQRPLDEIWHSLDRRRAARAVIDYAYRLQRCGLVHKDLYLNHFYARPGSYALTLIDLARVQATRSRRLRRKDLAALVLSARGLATRADLLRGMRRFGIRRAGARRIHRKAARMERHVPRNVRDGTHPGRPCT